MPRRNQRKAGKTAGKSPHLYYLNGYLVTTLEEWCNELGKTIQLPEEWWGDLDSVIVEIGMLFAQGADRPYTLVWLYSDYSRQYLHHGAMADFLDEISEGCQSGSIPTVLERWVAAIMGKGPTLFDFLVDIVEKRSHIVRLVLA